MLGLSAIKNKENKERLCFGPGPECDDAADERDRKDGQSRVNLIGRAHWRRAQLSATERPESINCVDRSLRRAVDCQSVGRVHRRRSRQRPEGNRSRQPAAAQLSAARVNRSRRRAVNLGVNHPSQKSARPSISFCTSKRPGLTCAASLGTPSKDQDRS